MKVIYSTLFKLKSSDLNSEAEVETRLLMPLFKDLGYSDLAIIPKKDIPSLMANDGSRKRNVYVDFILTGIDNLAKIIVEAKDPKVSIQEAWGQAASYALSYNRDKKENEKIKWLLISNGHITSLFNHDSDTPTVTLKLSDFSSGNPSYVSLRTLIKYRAVENKSPDSLPFETINPDKLNKIFGECHDLIWKKEKLAPTDAFFEFCKFIFIKIKEDKKRETLKKNTPLYEIPMTLEWLKTQESTSKHPVRDILFLNLREELETLINKYHKKRIFEKNEILRLSASTCKDLIKIFQAINLSSIDEDLNGRMFETFLNAAVRGRSLGQYFTPRSVVDFMTRIALSTVDIKNPPKVIDACCGTAGFLIEVMAYIQSQIRNDTRFSNVEKNDLIKKVCNESLYGIEANERVARIARINMYLHGDGGSHIFYGEGLDNDPMIADDMTEERKSEVLDHADKIKPSNFDIILTNPPFSMVYKKGKEDEERILEQREISKGSSSVKSNVLFLYRYYELVKPGGDILIVLDDTILNGKSYESIRIWMLENFILLGIHSLPFNAFFKAKANIKTSIIHLKRKKNAKEEQKHIIMSISNNIGHTNSLKDTPEKNNLTDILNAYFEWQRTGILKTIIKENQDIKENLECSEQVWLVDPKNLTTERFDAFFYSPELNQTFKDLEKKEKNNEIQLCSGTNFKLKSKLTKNQKIDFAKSKKKFKYIEISDVTKYGLILNHVEDTFDNLPTRGEYVINKGDILLAINNSSRGTVVLVPEEFDGAICTSGFLVIKPKNEDESYLLWYGLRSEYCRKQIYYLAQTASQPELKLEAWKNYFKIPMAIGQEKKTAIENSKNFHAYLKSALNADNYRMN